MNAITHDCYAGTTCLINKLNIKDEKTLLMVENGITMKNAVALLSSPAPQKLDFEYYKYIHKYLFEDLYDWAGKVRTFDMSKNGTAFCSAENLENVCQRAFARLARENYFVNCDDDKFVDEIMDFYCTSNMLHPFREGNGRTQRIFITQLIGRSGRELDFANVDKDELMIATVQAASGVEDGLRKIFSENIV